MTLKHRSYKKELLDGDAVPFEDIKRNMEELNFINTYLGGHSITVSGLRKLLRNKRRIHVCEIGCGGGDNLLALLKWCDQHKIDVQFTGIDIKQSCIDFAKTRDTLKATTKWITSDYQKVLFAQKPDIIFSSLFCHHFTEKELAEQLQWMKENCTAGFFINDLERNKIAYYSIKILSRLFSKSYLVKNDAPLSVARGFRKSDWAGIFKTANMHSAKIQWCWAFRHLIIYNKHAE